MDSNLTLWRCLQTSRRKSLLFAWVFVILTVCPIQSSNVMSGSSSGSSSGSGLMGTIMEVTTGETTTNSTSPPAETEPSLLDVLSDPPVYIALSGLGLLIILMVICGCIGCCVCHSRRKGMSSKILSSLYSLSDISLLNTVKGASSKKKSDDSAVRWTKEGDGQVQLLSIAEKAGVNDPDPSKPEEDAVAAQSVEHSNTEAGAEKSTDDDTGLKNDDKRVVTVATFGFPEVSIQPPPSPLPPPPPPLPPASVEQGNGKKAETKDTQGKNPSDKSTGV